MNEYRIYPKQYSNKINFIKRNTCFAIMPFAEEYDNLFRMIMKISAENSIICSRSDGINGSLPFLEQMIGTGMRIDEISKLQMSDINSSEHTILVHGKDRRQRMIYIFPEDMV